MSSRPDNQTVRINIEPRPYATPQFPKNPLEILPTELEEFYLLMDKFGMETFNEFDPSQIEQMLSRLEERQGILVPRWWEGSAEEFRNNINLDYSSIARNSDQLETLQDAQQLTLEILINYCIVHKYRNNSILDDWS